MNLLLSVKTYNPSEVLSLLKKLPRNVWRGIEHVYCLSNSTIINSAIKKISLSHKQVIYFPNNDISINSLISNLSSSKILAISDNVDNQLLKVLEHVNNYKIFVRKRDMFRETYVKDSDLFFSIVAKLENISFPHNNFILISTLFKMEDPIKQIILRNEHVLVIHFDDYLNIALKKFNIEVLKGITYSELTNNYGRLIKKDIAWGNRTIEFWIGTEHLNRSTLKKLISLTNIPPKDEILYRFIAVGKTPDRFTKYKIRVISLPVTPDLPIEGRINTSKKFYVILLKALWLVNQEAKIYNNKDIINKDLLYPLLKNYPTRYWEESIMGSLPSKQFLNKNIFDLEQPNFWYNFLSFQKNNEAQLKKVSLHATQKVKQIDQEAIKVSTEENVRVNQSSFNNRKEKLLKEISKQPLIQNVKLRKVEPVKKDNVAEKQSIVKAVNSTVEVSKPESNFLHNVVFQNSDNNYYINYNGKFIGCLSESLMGILIMKELVNRPYAKKIDAVELQDKIYKKRVKLKTPLPKPRTRNQGEAQKTVDEITANTLREARTSSCKKFNELKFLVGHFRFTKEGCYFDSKGILKITFTSD